MDKKYFAFISYKREDQEQAEWLRRKLEGYHLPAKLRKENNALPKTVRPVFRDSLELSGGFLAKEIETALSNSKYLIVICTPKSAASPWVNKEIETFVKQGREEYIIPFIIDGVPFSNDPQIECYPPALRALCGEKELLGININEMGREAAAVKVVARMFGLNFDTLWQRYSREQRRKRIGWGVFAVLLIILSLLFCAWLKGVNNELEERQDKLLISQSIYLVSEAQKEYDKGNITKALRMALYALPKDLENPDRPYITEAEYILRNSSYPHKEVYSRTILQHDSFVEHVVFSPDRRHVVTSSRDNTALVWDAQTGKTVAEPLRHDESIYSAVFSPDGKYIVTASEDSTACVWNAITGKPVGERIKHDSWVRTAFFSPDSKYVVTASGDCTARVWDVQTGKPLSKPLQHNDRVYSAVFSPEKIDGRYLVLTASCDSTACVWDVQTGKPLSKPLQHDDYVVSALFSPDGKYIVTASNDNTARVWDTMTGEPVTESLQHDRDVKFAVFSPEKIDGRYLVLTASYDKTARLWDAMTGKPVTEPLRHNDWVESATFSPDGKYVVTASCDNTARIWDAMTGKPVTEPLWHDNIVRSAAFSPDGKYVVTASWDNTARIWGVMFYNSPMGKLQHNGDLLTAIFTPELKYIVTVSRDYAVHVWDAITGKRMMQPFQLLSLRHYGYYPDAVKSVAFSSDSKYIAIASVEGIQILDAVTGRSILREFGRYAESLHYAETVAFSHDSKYIATASLRSVKIYDLAKRECVAELPCDGLVKSITFSPDGKYVVIASGGNTARIWNIKTGSPMTEPLKHNNIVEHAMFSHNGKYVITASSDNTARIWDSMTGSPVAKPLQHNHHVFKALFSPDSRYVVTVSSDHTVHVWNTITSKPVIEPMQHK